MSTSQKQTNIEFFQPRKPSSLVDQVAYRSDGECQVTLGSGSDQRVYQYHALPRNIFELWKTAESAGRFYNSFVKGRDADEVSYSDVWDE